MYGMTNDPLASIDLSNNKVSESVSLLKPGRYIAKSTKAEYENKDGKRVLKVRFVDTDGHGEITARFNLWAENDKAREIAGDQLVSFCTYGGHQTPTKPLPAGLASLPLLENLTVGIRVDNGKPYTKDGKSITPVEVKGFFEPSKGASGPTPQATVAVTAGAATGQRRIQDDEIPF